MTKGIGLLLHDKSGHRALDIYPNGIRFYAYHPSYGDDVGVLFSPNNTSTVTRVGEPFDWLIGLLQKITEGRELDILWFPPRKKCDQQISQLHEVGLIGARTILRQGRKILW